MFRGNEVYEIFETTLIEVILGLYSVFGHAAQPIFSAGFHLAILFYFVFAFKTGIGTVGYKTMFTGLLLSMNFNFITNMESYEEYLIALVFDTPKEIAEFIISANANNLGLKIPSETNMSQLYSMIYDNLIEQAGNDDRWMSVLPTYDAFIIYLAALVVYITYLQYWLVQFAFLSNVVIYMLFSPAVIMLSAFSESRNVFFEWFRAVLTVMLYPVIATCIIYLVNELIFRLALDYQSLENSSSPIPSGIIILIGLIACFSFSKVAEIANSLTRGNVSSKGSNPFQIGRDIIGATAKGISAAASAARAGKAAYGAGKAGISSAKEMLGGMRSDGGGESSGAGDVPQLPAPPVFLPHIPVEEYRNLGQPEPPPFSVQKMPDDNPQTQGSSSQSGSGATGADRIIEGTLASSETVQSSQSSTASQQQQTQEASHSSHTSSDMKEKKSASQQTPQAPSNMPAFPSFSAQSESVPQKTHERSQNFAQQSKQKTNEKETNQQLQKEKASDRPPMDLPPLDLYDNMPSFAQNDERPPLDLYDNMPSFAQNDERPPLDLYDNMPSFQQDQKDFEVGNPVPKTPEVKTNLPKKDNKDIEPNISV